jgi:hypothetical protein
MVSSSNNMNNNVNKNMTANFNGTITGLQASIGDLDINVNDARNIFNQNLGNTNLNIENHEEINQNLNSNVNPIGSGEIVSEKEDFQTFRNNLHHRIKNNELELVLDIIEKDDVAAYMRHEDYLKALYLVATVDYISKKHEIPLCDKFRDVRTLKLEQPYYVGDSAFSTPEKDRCIDEFLKYNIYEGDIYDAV